MVYTSGVTSMPVPQNLGCWWLTCRTWDRLHAVPGRDTDEDALAELPVLRAVCGITTVMIWPGFVSRLGMPRCVHCCRRLHIPAGKGTPANTPWRQQLGLDQPGESGNP